jgi:WS/DGAT/MGAT family acyltransferase
MSMQQLSGLDATFLYLETPQMPMHVGALHVLQLPPGYKGRYVSDLRRHVASRLTAAPALTRRLWWMPLNLANPAWVDAQPDLRHHIVEVRLPASARRGDGMSELQAQVSALHAEPLDRNRPLWKFYVFEGLAPAADGGRRVGLYTKLHHAAVDGQAAVALAQVLLDTTPTPAALPARRGRRRRGAFEPGMVEMLRAALAQEVQQVARIVRELPSTVGTLTGAARKALGRNKLLAGPDGVRNVTLAPATRFNASITASRAFATVSLPLAEVKAMGQAQEATINDMVLWLCSTALRRYLGKRHALPRKSLVAAVPISLREQGDSRADNQASMSLVSLGTNLADARKRLDHIKAAGAAMKSTMGSVKSILPTDFPSIGVPWLMEAAAALYGKARVADRIPQVANLVISNVPGPPMPLYMAGARMLSNFPASIIVHGLGLNVTVQSYAGALDFGLMADAKAAPDIGELADALAIAFDDLHALAQPQDEEAQPLAALTRAGRQLGGAVSAAVGGTLGAVVDGALGAAGETVARAVPDEVVRAARRALPSLTSKRKAR